jgi:hypothetical protein
MQHYADRIKVRLRGELAGSKNLRGQVGELEENGASARVFAAVEAACAFKVDQAERIILREHAVRSNWFKREKEDVLRAQVSMSDARAVKENEGIEAFFHESQRCERLDALVKLHGPGEIPAFEELGYEVGDAVKLSHFKQWGDEDARGAGGEKLKHRRLMEECLDHNGLVATRGMKKLEEDFCVGVGIEGAAGNGAVAVGDQGKRPVFGAKEGNFRGIDCGLW